MRTSNEKQKDLKQTVASIIPECDREVADCNRLHRLLLCAYDGALQRCTGISARTDDTLVSLTDYQVEFVCFVVGVGSIRSYSNSLVHFHKLVTPLGAHPALSRVIPGGNTHRGTIIIVADANALERFLSDRVSWASERVSASYRVDDIVFVPFATARPGLAEGAFAFAACACVGLGIDDGMMEWLSARSASCGSALFGVLREARGLRSDFQRQWRARFPTVTMTPTLHLALSSIFNATVVARAQCNGLEGD